nr:LbtU family siderophore porin [Thiocystis violacea]
MTEGAPKRLQKLDEDLDEKRTLTEGDGAWYRNIQIAGLIEVEAAYVSPYEGDSESDITLATVELGLTAQVNDWVEAGITLLYEQNVTDLEVDVAYIKLANADVSPVFLTAGQIYLPFGDYGTNLVSDPLTLEIGETRETALQVGFAQAGFTGSAYLFNGDNQVKGQNQIDGWGANLGFAHEQEGRAWALGIGYINDLGDSDGLGDLVNENRVAFLDESIEAGLDTSAFSVDPTDRTAGWTLNAAATFGPFNIIGEYLSATDDFDPISLGFGDRGAKPSAWNLEAGYSFEIMGRESVAALAYQGTDEALALELPKERWLVGWSVEILERTSLSLEWARDRDYGAKDGGTGQSGDTLTAQLAVEF